jgi:hypothetical protein
MTEKYLLEMLSDLTISEEVQGISVTDVEM